MARRKQTYDMAGLDLVSQMTPQDQNRVFYTKFQAYYPAFQGQTYHVDMGYGELVYTTRGRHLANGMYPRTQTYYPATQQLHFGWEKDSVYTINFANPAPGVGENLQKYDIGVGDSDLSNLRRNDGSMSASLPQSTLQHSTPRAVPAFENEYMGNCRRKVPEMANPYGKDTLPRNARGQTFLQKPFTKSTPKTEDPLRAYVEQMHGEQWQSYEPGLSPKTTLELQNSLSTLDSPPNLSNTSIYQKGESSAPSVGFYDWAAVKTSLHRAVPLLQKDAGAKVRHEESEKAEKAEKAEKEDPLAQTIANLSYSLKCIFKEDIVDSTVKAELDNLSLEETFGRRIPSDR